MRVWVRTVGQTRHMLLAKCRLEASGTRGAAAEVVESGGEMKGPLHGVKQQFHVLKSQFSELAGKKTWPYCRLVVLYQAAEKGFGTRAWKGKQVDVYGECWQLARQMLRMQ